jgi:drug/metabolite transporter superfamily protein YnfA
MTRNSTTGPGLARPIPVGLTLGLCLLTALRAVAEQPDSLVYALPAPSSGLQSRAELGQSVAVEGGYAVAGAPNDATGGQGAGVVKIFDTATGALLYVIPNPAPEAGGGFGFSVAISGTRLVVGIPGNNTGAENSGSAYVYDLASRTPTKPVVSLLNPNPSWLGGFGHAVALSGSLVVIGAPGNDVGSGDTGNVYVYDLASATPRLPVATLFHPSPMAQDRFGFAVAISGTRIAVGAPGDDTDVDNAGSAQVFDLASATPGTPVATLFDPSPSGWDQFGNSVALSGTRIVVGASWDDTAAIDAGSVHVYDLASPAPGTPLVTLLNPNTMFQGWFGFAVAISGTRVVVVGAGISSMGTASGSAYVYDLSSATPATPVATLQDPSPSGQIGFGSSVAIDNTSLVVGAPSDNTGAFGAGSAYAYDLASATPAIPVATFRHPGPSANDAFGNSVALSDTWIVVGTPRSDTGALGAGSVCVYAVSGATPTQPMILLNPSPAEGDLFGESVALSGTWIIVGTPGDDTGGYDAGTVYVYNLASATPTWPVAMIHNPTNPVVGYRQFGKSVAISGTRVVVGALETDDAPDQAGNAYVYDLASATPTIPMATLLNPSPSSDDRFGFSVAIYGSRVVVGTPGDDTTDARGAGSAYVYDLASATPTTPVVSLHHPSPSGFDHFGSSVAIAGTRIVVGAPWDDTGAENSGTAYVYDLASTTPTLPVATLLNPSPVGLDKFGSSVAISGTRIVVGVPERDMGAVDSGTTHVYDLASAAPTAPVTTLQNPVPTPYDWFGASVAISGTRIVVGTPGDASPQAGKGSAYVFGPGGPTPDGDGDGLRDAWERAYWPTTGGHEPMEDSDGDGYNELLELALGLNPTVFNSGGLPAVTDEGACLTMTLSRQPGVRYEVQTAATLLTGRPESFSAASTTILIDNASTLKVRDNFNRTTAPERLIHLRVTAAP